MPQRFDELELEPAIAIAGATGDDDESIVPASRLRRMMALLIDLSLFAALTLALFPILPSSMHWPFLAALGGFVIVVSYYYFVGAWLLWGRTIGGVIFDVRVVPDGRTAITLRDATMRWVALYLSLLTATIGCWLALLPSRRSLADRMSGTKCVTA
jgi:uncharacterized RDD family membrane protein YckC